MCVGPVKESTQQVYMERILSVLVLIQRNLDEELSLEEYARVAHFSPYHFHRIFRGMVGEHEEEYLRGPGMFSKGDPEKYLTIIRYRVKKAK